MTYTEPPTDPAATECYTVVCHDCGRTTFEEFAIVVNGADYCPECV